jgi:hypothetical protein
MREPHSGSFSTGATSRSGIDAIERSAVRRWSPQDLAIHVSKMDMQQIQLLLKNAHSEAPSNRGAISGTPRRFVPYHLFVFATLEIEPPPARGPETQKPPLRWLFVFLEAPFAAVGAFSLPVHTEMIKLVAAFPFKKGRTSGFSAALTRSENALSPLFGHFCS